MIEVNALLYRALKPGCSFCRLNKVRRVSTVSVGQNLHRPRTIGGRACLLHEKKQDENHSPLRQVSSCAVDNSWRKLSIVPPARGIKCLATTPHRFAGSGAWTAYVRDRYRGNEPELDIPLKERLSENIKRIPGEMKKWLSEQNPANRLKYRYLEFPSHNDLFVDWRFNTLETVNRWSVTCDADWSTGFSRGSFQLTDQGTGLFSGVVDPASVDDSFMVKAGQVHLASPYATKSFDRSARYEHWEFFNHIVLKVRGDGRRYKLTLSEPGEIDIGFNDIYGFYLVTHGGPYWQYARIPFSKFFLTSHGRTQDKQMELFPHLVDRIGISAADKIKGPFALEIDWIGVWYDVVHMEEFAYEFYRTPYPLGN